MHEVFSVQLDPVTQSLLSYIAQELQGKHGTDATTFIWQNGSVCSTIPATPDHLRGAQVFREIRKLPPVKKYSGQMLLYRQLGLVKAVEFVS